MAPKINKAIWGQLKQGTKVADVAMQTSQQFFVSAMYAIIEACQKATGEVRTTLTHALVLSLTGHRELSLKRRELLRPDLNVHYAALCNPITAELFGDDVGKEIDEMSKANKLGATLSANRRGRSRGFHPYGGFKARGYGNRGVFRGRGSGRGYSQPYPRSQSFLGGRASFRRKAGARPSTQTRDNRN